MSRSRLFVAGAVVLALVAATFVLAAGEATNDDLIKKLDALEQRIASLEKTLSDRLASLESKVASGGAPAQPAGPDPVVEREAQAAYNQINSLVSEGKYEEAKKQMGDFMSKYGATNTARQAARLNAELAVIGKEVPPKWGIEKWFQGESEVDLAGDKTTLLVFWEVWCPHCKREVPKLQELYTSLKGDGLQVVGLTRLTRGKTEQEVESFISEQSVKYPIAKEDGTLAAYFGVSGIPAAAVVKDGKVIWRGHPARLSESMIKDWL